MRFAFKTTPQNTTWADMLALWQAGDDIDVFESGWTFDHFYPIFNRLLAPCLEVWTTLTARSPRPLGGCAWARWSPALRHRPFGESRSTSRRGYSGTWRVGTPTKCLHGLRISNFGMLRW
jgi:hypothetical protein